LTDDNEDELQLVEEVNDDADETAVMEPVEPADVVTRKRKAAETVSSADAKAKKRCIIAANTDTIMLDD